MSIFGMIIAIGLLIDNAIVVVEEFKLMRRRGRAIADAITTAYGDDRTFSVPILTMCALSGAFGNGEDAWSPIPALPFELAALPQGLFHRLGLPVVSYALPTAGVGMMFLIVSLYLMIFATDVLLISPAAMRSTAVTPSGTNGLSWTFPTTWSTSRASRTRERPCAAARRTRSVWSRCPMARMRRPRSRS